MGHVGYLMFHPDAYSMELIDFLQIKETNATKESLQNMEE